MADFWGGFGQGFAPSYEKALDRRRAEEKRLAEIERLAEVAKQERLGKIMAYQKVLGEEEFRGLLPESARTPINPEVYPKSEELLPWKEAADREGVGGVFPKPLPRQYPTPESVMGGMGKKERIGLEVAAKLRYAAKLEEDKRKHEAEKAGRKRDQDIADKWEQRDFDAYLDGFKYSRTKQDKLESENRLLDEESSESQGELAALFGWGFPAHIDPRSRLGVSWGKGYNKGLKTLDADDRGLEVKKRAAQDAYMATKENVRRHFYNPIKALYYQTHGEYPSEDYLGVVDSGWSAAQKVRDNLLGLRDLQGAYNRIFSHRYDGDAEENVYTNEKLVSAAESRGYKSDLTDPRTDEAATNPFELERAIQEIYSAYDSKQKAADTGADVPYKYTTGYDPSGKMTYRTWVLKDNVDPALMLPSKQYRDTGKPTDSVADRWIQRANAGLKIEALRFGEDQKKGIPIRVVTAMDVWADYERGKGSDKSGAVSPRLIPPKAGDVSPRDARPVEEMLPIVEPKDGALPPLPGMAPDEPAPLPPLPGGEPEAGGIDIKSLNLDPAVERVMMAQPEGVPFPSRMAFNKIGQMVYRRGNKIFRVK